MAQQTKVGIGACNSLQSCINIKGKTENQEQSMTKSKKTFSSVDKNQEEKTENTSKKLELSHTGVDLNNEDEPCESLNTTSNNISKLQKPNTSIADQNENKSCDNKEDCCDHKQNIVNTNENKQSKMTSGMKILGPCCTAIHVNIWSVMMMIIVVLIAYLVTVFGFGVTIKQGISTVYNDVKYAGTKAIVTTINATQEAISLVESKLNGYHLQSHDVVQWQQVWTTISLDKLDSFSALIEISCDHEEFDDKLIRWFLAELKVLQTTESLTDGMYENTFYDNGEGHVRIGMLSIRENEEQQNKYKMLLACRQNKFTLSYDNFGWIRGAPPAGLEYFVFEKAKIELAHKIKRESTRNADGLIKICETNEDCKTD